jgi:hypothetical protein
MRELQAVRRSPTASPLPRTTGHREVAQGGHRCERDPAQRNPRHRSPVEATGTEVSLDRDRLAVPTQYAVPMRYDELLDSRSHSGCIETNWNSPGSGLHLRAATSKAWLLA